MYKNTEIVKNHASGSKLQAAWLAARSLWLVASLAFLSIALTGCAGNNQLEKAQDHVKEYELHYNAAISLYKELIKQGKDLRKLHFQLGQLYFSHSDFYRSKEEFKKFDSPQSKKFLAICNYHLGDFAEALKIFDESQGLDDQALYYYGLTSEKLNLYDKALANYKKIKTSSFAALARERLGRIEKQVSLSHIREISPFVDKILSSAPAPQNYPQAGAQILFCDEKVEVTPDNKEVSYLHYVVRILNERGKEGFSEAHIEYDSTYEKVELDYARTIKPDGKVVDVGLSQIRDVTKYLNFPLYSNARIYIISFPEIAEGASIEYKLKIIRNQLINKKDFVMGYPVQSSEPIIAANFTIELPKGKTLYIKTLNEKYNNFAVNLAPSIEQKENKVVYRWQFRDIPQIIPEANMPSQVEINPILLFSTFNKWEDVYSWWWSLAKDKIVADGAIKEKISELTRGLDSEEAKLRKIYNFCAQEIRYVAVEYGQAGYEPHQAKDIFKNKYGDCKDQAILLVTMLREEGFSAWPVLIGTKDYYNLNEDFPSMLFNHCIAAVSLKDKIIFLDPTAETCPLGDLPSGDQERRVLSCRADGYKIENTPLYPAAHNLAKQTLDIKIKDDESISAQKKIFTTGLYNQAQRYWLLYTVPDLIRDQLEAKIQEISIGARLDSYNIENLDTLDKTIELSYKFHGPEYFTNAGKLRVMPQLASLDTSLVAKDRRRYPIDFGVLDSKEAELKLRLPSNFVIKYMPEDIVEDSPWMKFTLNYKKQGNELIFSQKIELKKNNILENQYADFKKFFEGLARKIKQRIVLERIK
jgi:tetratricopeptide (TPR) repeat protein